jgi:hypothetical protein
VVLLLERALVSWSLAINEHDGHEDLRGSGRRSVIPYVHGRTKVVLFKSVLSEPAFSSVHVKRRLPEPFIAQDRPVTLRSGA